MVLAIRRQRTLPRQAVARWAALIVLATATACNPAILGSSPPSMPATVSASPAPAGGPQSNAGLCQLLAPADITSAIGRPAVFDRRSSNPDSCTYALTDPDASDSYLNFRVETGFEDLASVRQAFAGGQDVEEIGDRAYWVGQVTALWFEKAEVLYAIQLVMFDQDALNALSAVRRLAQVVLSRL